MRNATIINNQVIRHSVALNNIGATLLGKTCYDQALETLKDAVTLMRLSLPESDEKKEVISARNTGTVKMMSGMHHQALQRLAQPRVCLKRPVINVEVLTLSQASSLEASIAAQESQSTLLTVIRIEDILPEDNGTVPDIDASVILHNLGIAYLVMSLVTIPNSSSMKYHVVATQLLRFSHALCRKSLAESMNHYPEKLMRMIITSRNLIQSLQLLNKFDEVKQLETMMADLKARMNRIQRLDYVLRSVSRVAPAA